MAQKYERWILKEKQLASLSDVEMVNDEGNVLQKVNYVYECPYCHQTITCWLSNKLTIRKCRFCSHPVSPYQGEIVETMWVPNSKLMPS